MLSTKLIWTVFLFPIIICLNSSVLYSTNIIEGVVLDKETANPLPSVHVYISGTTIGTITDENGEFSFGTDLRGTVTLVFSYVGYRTYSLGISLETDDGLFFVEIELDSAAVQIGEIEILESNREWEDNYALFADQFIGRHHFSNSTQIENSWVLDFTTNARGELRASASKPIIVVNNALGYRIHIDLIEFIWNQNTEAFIYTFYSRFEELSDSTDDEYNEWIRNRQIAYQGSFRHFLSSLYHDRLFRNRFEIVQAGGNQRSRVFRASDTEVRDYEIQYSLMNQPAEGAWRAFKLRTAVDILYGRRAGFNDDRVRSRLIPLHPSGVFLISETGHLHDPLSLKIEGGWSSERISNLLPSDLKLAN